MRGVVVEHFFLVARVPPRHAQHRHRWHGFRAREIGAVGEVGGQQRIRGGGALREWDEHGLRDHAEIRRERLLVERVAERKESHALRELRTAPPEKLLPLEADDEALHLRVIRCDRHATFVEERERIALRAAMPRFCFAALVEDRRVLRIDCGLGARVRDPGERVEKVVPVFQPRLDFAGLRDAQLVVATFAVAVSTRRDEPERLATRGRKAARKRAEFFMCRPAVARQPRQRGPQGIVDRRVQPG